MYRWVGFFFVCYAMVFGKPLQVEVKAACAMVMDADSGAILYEKQGYVAMPPASTTKIATLLFALEEKKIALDQKFAVSEESLKKKGAKIDENTPPYWWDTDGTRMWLCAGEVVPVDALLHGLMMVSGNDAANVIAEGLSGSVPQFVTEMNLYLQKIGCRNTHFVNPHGCHHPQHVSTAYDLCVMTKRALKIEKFRSLVSTMSYTKAKTNKQGPVELKQVNQLLKPGRFYYSKAIGVKTGFHSAALNTLVAAATHNGRTLIAAIIGAQNREDRYQDAIRLFEEAFAEEKITRCFFPKTHLFTKEITGASSPLHACLAEDLSYAYYPSEETNWKAFVSWKTNALPIKKGEVVGEVLITDTQGNHCTALPLYAKTDVSKTFFAALNETIKKLFRR